MASVETSDGPLFAEWQRSRFDPAALPAAAVESGELSALISLAIQSDPVRGVRALMYHLDRPDCLAMAREFVTEEWVRNLIELKGRDDPDALELFVLLADASFCRDAIMSGVAGHVAEGPYSQALARVLNNYAPPDLVQRTAQALASLGFLEILENEDLLRNWTVSHGYIQLLSESQYEQLCDHTGVICARDLLARWLSSNAPVNYPPIPDAPARFHDAASLWQWIYEKLVFIDADLAATWTESRDRHADIFDWWQNIQRLESQAAGTAEDEIQSLRRLNLDESAEAPQFQMRLSGELWEPEELLSQLKSEAAVMDPIYGQSARAAQVALRNEPEKCAALKRLEPIEVLSASETMRYLYLYGADVTTASPQTAVRLARLAPASSSPSSPHRTARHDLVTFRARAPFELVANVMVRNFASSCNPAAALVENGVIGLYIFS